MGTKKPVERLIMSKRAVEFLEEWVSVIECFETDGGVSYRSDRLILF